MLKLIDTFSVIRDIIPYTNNISRPKISGSLRNVFIAKSIDGTFVCKFNHRDMAVKNSVISESMEKHGISAPKIRVYNHNHYWIEVYPIIPGKTLYEHIGNGLKNEAIQYLYHDIVDLFVKMNDIDVNILDKFPHKYTHQVAKTNISDVNNPVLGAVFSGAVQLMNRGAPEDVGIYHCGITPKNVILDENGKFAALLDLDEVAIADINYAFAMMAGKYQKIGNNPMDLVDYYECRTGRKLNHKKIQKLANLTNVGKYLLWHNAKHNRGK